MIIWLCGQPGSGKTTLARLLKSAVQKHIFRELELGPRTSIGANYKKRPDLVQIIDGDGLRSIFNNQDYTPSGRDKNLTDAITVARWLDSQGFFVIMALVAPYVRHRNALHTTHQDKFVEVYLHTSEKRGREKWHVENFELPTNKKALTLDTGKLSEDICAYEIMLHLLKLQEQTQKEYYAKLEQARAEELRKAYLQTQQIKQMIDNENE